jgi:diguanylate cyclase (GGDEF)-like protein
MAHKPVASARFQEVWKARCQQYQQQLPDKIAEIQATWHSFLQYEDTNEEKEPNKEHSETTKNDEQRHLLHQLHRFLHSLAGSSPTYGFQTVGTIARKAEQIVQEMENDPALMTAESFAMVESLLGQLTTAAEQTGQIEQVEQAPQNLSPSPSQSSSPNTPSAPNTNDNRLIFVIDQDSHFARDLAHQIGHFGYTVRTFASPSGLLEHQEDELPAAIIINVVFPDGNLADMQTIAHIRNKYHPDLAVIFVSSLDEIPARLQAVRAGGRGYFTKPVNVSALVDKLDALTAAQQPEPYRILIVDDDPDMISYFELCLQKGGMHTYAVSDPMHVLQPLLDFRPDLILMDLYMPGCTGLELASVIRQQETFVGIPIVFLSTETSIEKQLKAMNKGGDDFLTKPIQEDHLISAVMSRAHRSRVLRASMVRDSLTGLLNHTTTKERLHREVLYAERRDSPLSFAMIDIDKFKSVNDTYGHAVGDRVIKSLSRILQQRLRRSDILGRYGGEEFAVMLPDTDGLRAVSVLDNIRRDFAQIRQQADGVEFSVTFSGGVADYPTYGDAASINRSADEALYEAKMKGRNRIVLRGGANTSRGNKTHNEQ